MDSASLGDLEFTVSLFLIGMYGAVLTDSTGICWYGQHEDSLLRMLHHEVHEMVGIMDATAITVHALMQWPKMVVGFGYVNSFADRLEVTVIYQVTTIPLS
jgi:hypothetical protein